MYYSDEYLCHYGVLGMKWGQHLMAKAKTASASNKAKRAQRKSDIAEGKKHASYSLNRATRSANDRYADIGSSARRSANHKIDNMKYKKQVQNAEEKHGVATRIHQV